MLHRALALAVLVAATLAAPAQAGWKIDRAKAIAAEVWHHPCAGHVTVDIAPLPDAIGEAYTDECRIVLNSWQPWGWQQTCTTMLHEYGHLAGYRDPANIADPWHSSNPRSIMYAGVELPDGALLDRHGGRVDARCDERGRPFLARNAKRPGR